jgi:hypothetical protein
MIKNIICDDPSFLIVVPEGSIPYLGSNYSNPLHGMVRLKDSNFEVFDSNANTWMTIWGVSTRLKPTAQTQDVLKWAQKRMQAEAEAERLAATNPTVADALSQVQVAQHQLDTVVNLIKEPA